MNLHSGEAGMYPGVGTSIRTAPTCVQFPLMPTDSTELQVLDLVVKAIAWGKAQDPALTDAEAARIAWYINDRFKR